MENLELYEKVRSVPENAQKEIKGGRLKGMTDINPMWRIKKLTEEFGVCGIGWIPKIVRTWLDKGENNEVIASVEIELRVKVDGEWSEPIPGIGGSKAAERHLYGRRVLQESIHGRAFGGLQGSWNGRRRVLEREYQIHHAFTHRANKSGTEANARHAEKDQVGAGERPAQRKQFVDFRCYRLDCKKIQEEH